MNVNSAGGTVQPSPVMSVVGAIDALKNHRALIINVAGNLAAALLFFMFASMHSVIIGVAGFLIAALVSLSAFNAAGIVLMGELHGVERQSTGDALIAGVFATVQGIGVLLAGFLILLAVALLIAVLMFLCKMPGIGPILFIPVFPVSVVIMGLAIAAFAFLLMPVASASIWSGEGMVQALSRVLVAAQERMVGILVRNLALLMLIGLAGLILGGLLANGFTATAAMSAGIIGTEGSLSSIGFLLGGGLGGQGGLSHVTAAMIGGAALLALVFTLPLVMLQKGWCLIYRELVENLDAAAIEAEMQQKLAEVRQRAAAAQQRVREQSQRATAPSVPPAAAGTASTPAASAGTCPSCNAAFQAADTFCGECGAKLQ